MERSEEQKKMLGQLLRQDRENCQSCGFDYTQKDGRTVEKHLTQSPECPVANYQPRRQCN